MELILTVVYVFVLYCFTCDIPWLCTERFSFCKFFAGLSRNLKKLFFLGGGFRPPPGAPLPGPGYFRIDTLVGTG